jgi:hypothetical protein
MNKLLRLSPILPLCLAAASLVLAAGEGRASLAAILAAAAAIAASALLVAAARAGDTREKAWKAAAARRGAEDAALAASDARLRAALSELAAAFPKAGNDSGLGAAIERALAGGSMAGARELGLLADTARAGAALAGAGGKGSGAGIAAFQAGGTGGDGAAVKIEDARSVLPLARKIVAAVPGKTEEATMALIERFTEVRELSSKAADASREAMAHMEGGGGRDSFQARALRTKSAIEAERKAVMGMVENNRQNSRKLQAMSKELESGIELMKGIEEITERSRLIAFNMAVEAARIGEKGRGFRVIVNELRSLNDRTQEFSVKVAELLGSYREYNASLVAGMAEHSEKLSGEVMGVMGSAGEAVESLIDSSTTMGELSARLAGLVKDVDRDLDGVLEALQFQDVTRQMLEGSIHIIEAAEARLDAARPLVLAAGGGDEAATRRRFEAMRRAFIDEAKTKDEKQAMMEVLP